jgi:enoyl-[acyl-carrier protein] reductase III
MNQHPFDLTGKRILVTGGTRGIGRAISRELVRAGARVVANYARDDDAAQSLQTELGSTSGQLEVCRADITSAAGKQRVVDCAADGGVSGFVHCAATGVYRTVPEFTRAHWDFTFALNVRAFFEIVQALLPRLATGSSIVAVSSAGAARAFPQYGLVGASKGAIEALCRHLALELAPRGIRVNVVSPGTVLTAALDALPDKDAIVREAIQRSPSNRLTTPEEVAYAVHFLCSDGATGLNGHTLVVDGGQQIRG